MKQVDVLIIYEHKTRELENCALLAAELEHRGYQTEVLYMYATPKRWNIKAKVVVTPHLYNEQQLSFFLSNKKNNNQHVVDLQYEQVLSESSEDGIHNPSGLAMLAHHIAWGEAQTQRYLKHGVNKMNVHETGSISMDLFRPEFSQYFISREDLGKMYNIDPQKEWILFISSFSYAHRSKSEIEHLSKLNPNAEEFAKLSELSYHEILDWFETALSQNPEKVFIYRRHPSELNDNHLLMLEKKYQNFRCIDSYSMRQWTVTVNKIYNWFSTSLADVFYAGKSCCILRPCHIPERLDVAIMSGGDFIKSKSDFLESINNQDELFPVAPSKIEYYYANRKDGQMAFQKTADLCEKLIHGDFEVPDYKLNKGKCNMRFIIKYLYDYAMYEYGIRVKTPYCIIKILNTVPFLKNTAFKLDLFNKDLYKADKLLSMYKTKFIKIIDGL